MEPQIQYAKTSDGVSIAYKVEGEGPPLLVCYEGVESFSLDHEMPDATDFFRGLGRGRCVIRFDPRGVGLSQRGISDFSLQAAVRDLLAVVQATGLSRVSVLAWCVSGPRAIAFVAAYPELVDRLILYATTPRPTNVVSKETMLALAALWRTNPDVAVQAFSDLTDRERYPEFGARAASVLGQSITPTDAARWIEAAAEEDIDVTPLLSQIRAPTLVLLRRGDGIYTISEAQTLAAEIPNARLILFEASAHFFALEDPGAIIDAVNEFLGNTQAATSRPQKTASSAADVHTVLFTDLVSSTALTQRLGDAKAQELVRAHNAIVRQALAVHGGSEIKQTGDGIMASFTTSSGALQCAAAIQHAVADRGDENLRVHIGVNAGEPLAEEADLFGTSVQLARRICDHASAGQVLVSNVVRELAAGKDFLFTDAGEVVPKGFDEAVRLYELRWRE